jgi:hypothetical protein
MPLFEAMLAAGVILAGAPAPSGPRTTPASSRSAAPSSSTAPSGPAAASGAPKVPTCMDLDIPIEAIPSKGSVRVPTMIDAETGYRDSEAGKEINRRFKLKEVEKLVFDGSVDMPSQARVLNEYRCFGTWKTQHDFYRRIVRDSHCAYLRHRAIDLLQYDLCAPDTVTVLIDEFKKSLYPMTRELILKRLGMSADKRAVATLEEALKSKSPAIVKAAKEAKIAGQGMPCMAQEQSGKPYYGYMEVQDVCEGVPDTSAGIIGNGGNGQSGGGTAAEGEGKPADKETKPGVSNVEFGK